MTSLPERLPSLHPVIPVYRPDLSGNEQRYVMECLETNWISSIGTFIPRFETAIAQTTGAAHAIAVSNGTVALHLALHCLGIGPGDEVIVPTFTYMLRSTRSRRQARSRFSPTHALRTGRSIRPVSSAASRRAPRQSWRSIFTVPLATCRR